MTARYDYRDWDGTQEWGDLDPDDLLAELTDDLLSGGDLNDALRSMTEALWQRLNAIESFAADVAHELKNPLTSLRSAIEVAVRESREAAWLVENREAIDQYNEFVATHGLFSDVHDEVGHIIVADVSPEGVRALVAPDRERLNALIERRYPGNHA